MLNNFKNMGISPPSTKDSVSAHQLEIAHVKDVKWSVILHNLGEIMIPMTGLESKSTARCRVFPTCHNFPMFDPILRGKLGLLLNLSTMHTN